MPKLLVMPEETFTMIKEAGVQFAKLQDINYMAKNLSATDMADIHVALQEFPFYFSKELGIDKATSPLDQLAGVDNPAVAERNLHEDMYNRVNGRIDTYQLRKGDDLTQPAYSYRLFAVDESLWVAVQQRLRAESSDPSRVLLRANQPFFDELMAEALRTMPFNRVCSTNLFTYYLGSLHQ